LITIVTGFTVSLIHFPWKSHKLLDKLAGGKDTREAAYSGENIMRLQLITGAVILYTLAAMAWLCYVGIGAVP
jgi:hypothetical protein